MEELALRIPGIGGGSTTVSALGGIPTAGYYSWNFPTIIQTFFTILIIVSIILALLFLILGAFSWITSEGDKQKLAQAKQRITFSIIGLVVVFLSFFIINVIYYFFRVSPRIGG